MFTVYDLLAGTLLPVVVALTVLAAGWRWSRRRLGRSDGATFLVEPAVGLGFAAGWLALFGRSEFPPLDATEWLLWSSVPLATACFVVRRAGAPLELRLGVAALAVATIVTLVAWPLVAADDLQAKATRWRVAFAGVWIWGCVAGMDLLGQRITFRRSQVLWLAACGTAAIALMMSGSQRLAQSELLLASTGLGCLATTLLIGRAGDGVGLAAVVGTLHGTVVLCGHLYADLGAGSAMLLAAAPCAAWIAEPLAHHRHGAAGVRRAIAQVVLVLALAAPAVVIAWREFRAALE